MQTIYIDISNKGVIPTLYTKQGDIGRKFIVVFKEYGMPYSIPNDAMFSVWYKGASGEGNYTDIGEKSAFEINDDSVTVEIISQMLGNPGGGFICLVLSKVDGGQIGSWNIPYICEEVPGFGSEEATVYYTAFSKTLEGLRKNPENIVVDSTLSNSGEAADAKATGQRIEEAKTYVGENFVTKDRHDSDIQETRDLARSELMEEIDGTTAWTEKQIQTALDNLDTSAKEDLNDVSLWEQGGIDTDGSYTDESHTAYKSYIRTKDYLSEDVEMVYAEKDYAFRVAVYDSSDVFKGFWTGNALSTGSYNAVHYINPKGFRYLAGLEGCKIRLSLKRWDVSEIGVDESANIHFLDSEHKKNFCKPTLTFIDDDGSIEALTNWEAISDETGVKVTSALTTGIMREENAAHGLEFEVGNIDLVTKTDDEGKAYKTIGYSPNDGVSGNVGSVRSKPDFLYHTDYETAFTLSSYEGAVLYVYYSTDGGKTYSAEDRRKSNPAPVIVKQNALVAVKIMVSPWANLNGDTSLADRLVVCISPAKVSWDDVARLQNRGFEFVSHTHKHIDIVNIRRDDQTPEEWEKRTDESVEADFVETVKALREHGCESRYLVYPYNSVDAGKMDIVKKYFTSAVGLGGTNGDVNRLPVFTYYLRRYSVNKEKDATSKYPFRDEATLKGYIHTTLINGGWLILMSHMYGGYYHGEANLKLIADICKYAIKNGMDIQTFGEAFQRYKNVMEGGTINGQTYGNKYYIADCNGVEHYRGQEG